MESNIAVERLAIVAVMTQECYYQSDLYHRFSLLDEEGYNPFSNLEYFGCFLHTYVLSSSDQQFSSNGAVGSWQYDTIPKARLI